jgi:hypothetical protein
MLSLFNERFGGGMLVGLPVAALDLALLWTPLQRLQVRQERGHCQSTATAFAAHPAVQTTLPKWPWEGWIGQVDYRLLQFDKEPAPVSLVEEFFTLNGNNVDHLKGFQRASANVDRRASNAMLARHFSFQQGATHLPPSTLHFIAPLLLGNGKFDIDRTRKPDYLSASTHISTQIDQAVFESATRTANIVVFFSSITTTGQYLIW